VAAPAFLLAVQACSGFELQLAPGTAPELGDGAVVKLSLRSGPAVTLASGQAGPRRIAIDSTHVFWTTYPGHVCRVPN
jgi:hypothetical protein